jgi:RNA recognition motif-containing protein
LGPSAYYPEGRSLDREGDTGHRSVYDGSQRLDEPSNRTTSTRPPQEVDRSDQTAASSKKVGEPGRRTVIVTNVPSDLDSKDLKRAFSAVGVVELCLIVDGMTQITFNTAESALKAVETYNKGKLNGQRIAVKVNDGSHFDTKGGVRGVKKTVLVTNLPAKIHWRNIKSAFSVAGRVDLCRAKDGMAEITFRHGAAAQRAVDTYHGGDLNGKRIAVRFFDASQGVILVSDDLPATKKSLHIDENDSRAPAQRLGFDIECI